MDDLSIKKRDGVVEYFSIDKLIVSIGKTGVPLTDAEKIAEKVKKWLKSKKSKGVTSSQIRDKIIEFMINNFPAEADSFKAYKK